MLKTMSGFFREQSRKVEGRSWALKLLTLLLTLFLLLSFSLSAFAWPRKYSIRDLDEHPVPGVSGNSRYFVIFQSGNGFIIISVYLKSSGISIETTKEKQSVSPHKNGQVSE